MNVYIVQSDNPNNDELRLVFGQDMLLGQTKQSNVTIVFSALTFNEIKAMAAKLPSPPDGRHRFDVVSLGETTPL